MPRGRPFLLPIALTGVRGGHVVAVEGAEDLRPHPAHGRKHGDPTVAHLRGAHLIEVSEHRKAEGIERLAAHLRGRAEGPVGDARRSKLATQGQVRPPPADWFSC